MKMKLKTFYFLILTLLIIPTVAKGSISSTPFVFTGTTGYMQEGLQFNITNPSNIIQVNWQLNSTNNVKSVLESMSLYPFDSNNEIEMYTSLGSQSTGTTYFYDLNERSGLTKFNLTFTEGGIDNSFTTANYKVIVNELTSSNLATSWSGNGSIPEGMSAFKTDGSVNITWNATPASSKPIFVLIMRNVQDYNQYYFITTDAYDQQTNGAVLHNTVTMNVPAGTYYLDSDATDEIGLWNISVQNLGTSTTTNPLDGFNYISFMAPICSVVLLKIYKKNKKV